MSTVNAPELQVHEYAQPRLYQLKTKGGAIVVAPYQRTIHG
jgi:hypothetical protein